jgi:hypothetical protein
MRVLALLAVVATGAALGLAAPASPAGAQGDMTASQLVARFRAATGSRLLVDRRASQPGRYTALVLPPSISNQGRFGRFVLYVVSPRTRVNDLVGLLADAHTGELGTPGPSRIYWESGRYLSGERYWLAKKQYGSNVVLWWYGSEHRIDKAFKRLHVPLRRAVAA